MKNNMLTSRHRGLLLSILALVIGLFAPAVQAQMATTSVKASSDAFMEAVQAGWTITMPPPVITNLSTVDFDQLTKEQWKQLRREVINTLRTNKDEAWERAALHVIYLSFYYRDQINFERASTPLLEAYILDRDETHRILALAAMHAIGDHDTMAHLAQRVRLEASPRVRRLTTAAVADYFTPATPVKVGPARQIGGSL